MSSGKGYSFANKVVDFNLGGTTYTPPATLYIALFNAPITLGGVSTAEVSSSGTGYGRAAVANNPAQWPPATNGSKSNANQIAFPSASIGSWGLVVALAIMDAPTGGNVLYYGSLTQAINVTQGDTVEIPPGALTVVEG